MRADNSSLTKRAMRAVAWGYGGTFVRMAMQLGAQAVLARLLGPAEFGVFAALMLLAAVAVLAADLVSAPIIQSADLTAEQLAFACACQLFGSLLVAILVMACLPFYRAMFPLLDDIGLGLAFMAAGTLVTGLSGVSLSLLRRHLRYREIQTAQVAGYFAGYILLAIPLALAGFKTYQVLVLAWLGQAVVSSALLYAAERHAWTLSFSVRANAKFLTFGAQISLGNIGNWLASSGDRVLVTKFAGPVEIGYYNTMLNLLMTPVVQLAASLNTVAFSVAAQSSQETRRRGALAYLNLTAMVACLLYGVFFAFPESFVALIYGPRWLGGAAFVQPFCLAAVGFAIGAAANAVLTSTGKGSAVAMVQAATACLLLIAVFVALRSSVLLAAQWMAGVYLLRAIALTLLSLRHVGAGLAGGLTIIALPLFWLCVQVLLARQVADVLALQQALVRMLLSLGAGCLMLGLALALRRQVFLHDAQLLLTRLLARLFPNFSFGQKA
ncbi:oligosaccharide flippase family protein [Paucibacter oligotrophus]|uniref:Oligosaccharide flippase family protein n=1 Tax=Roseateles oligotrophus TaxID=1769250 RepID=A0ABT2YJH2_9BURK|nr:oligosaccharide flippase family protein [Roseateles oligotrophus]